MTQKLRVLNRESFARIRDLLYKKVGIYFDDHKLQFLDKRVEKRMKALQSETAMQYHFTLKFDDPEGKELEALVNLVTTNETYMFREYDQLAVFSNACLPQVLRERRGILTRKLRVWSAGCSSGEEAYTLAIILIEVMEDHERVPFEVIATDIDRNMLRKVERGVYDDRSVRYVPPEYFDRHLSRCGNAYLVCPTTREHVKAQYLNLHDAAQMRQMCDMDFIFCRNVLIYFDDRSRLDVILRFYDSLNPGGYVFLGHAESIDRITRMFECKRVQSLQVYRKPT